MSDLQIGLILLGVVLILAVLVFNWWQDWRVRQKMRDQFPEREDDPLMGAPAATAVRREPGLGLSPQPVTLDDDADDPDEVDPATEVVIDVSFAQSVGSAELYEAVKGIMRVGTKPVRVFAEREGGGHRAWIRPAESYVSVQLAVLLANRSGPLTDIEWSQLWTLAQSLADRFDGAVEGPEIEAVLERATALDAVCADLDAQVGLILKLNQPHQTESVFRVLEGVGFLRGDVQLAWMSDQGLPRFVVQFDGVPAGQFTGDHVQRLDFVLDVPKSPADEQAFSRMATVGRDLARRLDAVLLDDQGRPLPDHADDAVDQQLHALYMRLEEAGYPAGEPRTARLFS